MMLSKSIIAGVAIYLALFFGEKGIHFIYFYITHDFSTSNLLMIKSSLLITAAVLLGGGVAGYLSNHGLLAGFIVGTISGLCVLTVRQFTGAAPFTQEFTPAILFDEVLLKACYCAAAGGCGQLVKIS